MIARAVCDTLCYAVLCYAGLKVGDIWSQDGPGPDADWTAPTTGLDLIRLGKRKQQPAQQQQQDGDSTPAAAVDSTAAAAAKRSKKRRGAGGAVAVAPLIPAVEVDAPGCSFNPEPEAHQDALAAAVAAEYKKQLQEEMAPKAPSQYAPAGYKPQDELEALLVDAEIDEEDEQQQQQLPAAVQDENAIALDDSEDEADAGGDKVPGSNPAGGAAGQGAGLVAEGKSSSGSAKKTKKDRNKEARRKQQESEAAARAALKQQRRELERLGELQEQLQEEEREKELLRQRRQVGHSLGFGVLGL
jgi:nucleolar protein 53